MTSDLDARAPSRPGTLKAWTYERYGLPDVLEFREVPFPPFRDDHELLIRVQNSSVNPADRHMLKPSILFRRGRGFLRPKSGRLGSDLAGRVEVVGHGVEGFHVGDEVFGIGRGAFGEYAIADHTQVNLKSPRITFEQAAALPIAAVTALQALRDKGQVRPGSRVLINGASGGVGTFAVQIAKALGADVTCVCSSGNVEQARSLGADRVFDYSREDFTKSGLRFDVILDTQLNHSLSAYRRVLTPTGVLVIVGAGGGSALGIVGRLLKVMLAAKIVGPKSKFFIASVKKAELAAITELVEAGKVTAVIDRRYPLGQVPDAMRYLAEGHARGKIVITM
jgi:NADPH:quinone reductase-like Zn-dependent oxidoreductase